MAAKKVGTLIKEARTAAGLSQAALAELIDGVSASDIGKAERGEKQLTNDALKAIAKATGVTQKSLLDAAKKSSSTASGKGSSTGAKKDSEIKLTAAEKTLINAYRKADADTQKAALKLLKGEKDVSDSLLGNLLTNVLTNLSKQ
ncbi:MAG: helix-turn-helix transcriptional regulator [Firmicutes bacterium]|nr:helix-turn-helix transcriptional regulator [Bacillota bacterium]